MTESAVTMMFAFISIMIKKMTVKVTVKQFRIIKKTSTSINWLLKLIK